MRLSNNLNLTAAVGLLVSLTGCATSPKPTERTAAVEAPKSWATAVEPGQAETAGSVDADGTGWLAQFNDPKLNTLVNEALQQNLDLQATAARLQAARANASIAGADQYPQLGAGLSGARRQIILDESGADPTKITSDNYGLSLDLSWELDVWGRLRDRGSAAIGDYEAVMADYKGARLSLVGNTAKSWFRTTTARQLLDLANETVASFESTVSLVRSRFESGISTSLDLRLALANAAGARALKQLRAQEYEQSVRSLEVLIGKYPANSLATVDELPELSQPIPVGLPSELLNRRPDIVAAERRLASSDLRVSEARKNLLPSLRLTASGGTASEDLSNIADVNYSVWSLVGGLTQPLFQGGRLKANVERSKAEAQQDYLAWSRTVLNAFQEVEDTLAGEQFLSAREKDLLEAAVQSMGAQSLAEDEYAAGLTEIITVLESQRRALNAQNDYLTIREQRLRNRVDLHLALGGDFGPQTTVATN